MSLAVPFHQADLTAEEEDAVLRVMRSGWLTSGTEMKAFEAELVAYLGGGTLIAVACSSATAGMHLALEAVGVRSGDRVLVPTWTFTATAEVVEYVGAIPVLVDVDPVSKNVTVDHLDAAWTPQTTAVLVVHVAGVPCDMPAIWSWARRRRVKVIEDAAHALGSWVGGVPVGAGQSEATVFSFYATKTLTTGEGGAVVTKSSALARRMQQMRLHGIDHDVFDRYTANLPRWEYDVVAAGFKYNLPDVLAAMGRVQLRRLDEMGQKRQTIAARYDAGLAGVVVTPPKVERVSHHLYMVDVPRRGEVMDAMYAKGVACSVHFKPLHKMTYWKRRATVAYPGADQAYEGCLSLPIYPTLTDGQMDLVIESLTACLR